MFNFKWKITLYIWRLQLQLTQVGTKALILKINLDDKNYYDLVLNKSLK